MWIEKIKNNKGQYVLFALIVFITIAVFSMSFSFVAEIGAYSKNLLNDENSSDFYMMTMHNQELEDSITDEDAFDNIESYDTYEGYQISVPMVFDDQNIAMLFQSALETDNNDDMSEFELVESKDGDKVPAKGEIWIPLILSDPLGINLGDTIVLEYEEPLELEVSGIYKAKVLVTQNLGFSPVIMSTDDLETVSDNEIPIRLYGMDLYTFDDNSVAAIKDSTIGMSFSVTREQLRGNFEMSANVMGNMGAIAAVVIFIASLAIIRYIISNNIVNEYRSIGIYKSLGYTNRQIAGFYRTGYLIVGLVATILGSFALLPVTKILGNISTKFATSFEITNISLITCAISIVIFMVLIFINITYSLRVIKKRTAVEIIRDDQSKGVGKVSKSVIKKASSAFAMAINNMFKHKRQTILSALSFMIASYLAMIFLTIGNSAHYMDEHYNSWFAIPENDVYVSGVLTDDVLEYLEDSDDVESFIYGSVVSAIPVSTDSVDISMNLFNFDVFNDANPEKTTVKITGDTPTKNDEIILTSLALQVLEMDVGDTISLTIDDTTKDYKIVGSYSSMLSNFGIMMTTEAMEEVYRDYVPNRAFVNLNDGVTISAFADDVEDSFTEVSVDEDWFFMDTAMQSTRTMLTSISSIMVVVFLLFTILSVSIIISINLENKMREAGIMKSLGFTGGYILRMNLYTSLITSIISIGFALVLHVTLSRRIIAQMMVDAVEDPVGLIAIFIALVLLITVVVTLIMNRKVYKVSPKILMEE